MKIINKNTIMQLANDVLIKVDDDFITEIIADINSTINDMKVLDAIDTSLTTPMYFPHSHVFHNLRSDEQTTCLSQATVMKIAPQSENGYITIPTAASTEKDF